MRHLRQLGASMVLFVFVLGTVFTVQHATAQDATPADGACAPLTRDEVIVFAQTYIQAIQSGNALLIDIILQDDVTHNLADEDANAAGNDDEALIFEQMAGAELTTEQILVDDQTAVVRYTFDLARQQIAGSAVVILTLECGQVSDIQQESTDLGRQVDRGELAAEATPES